MNTPTPSLGQQANSVLTALGEVNGYVQLAITIANVVIPIGKVLVADFKAWLSGSTQTLTLVQIEAEGEAEGANVVKLSDDDLAAINAELVRQGATPLVIPKTP
jgi:hypothetical protein